MLLQAWGSASARRVPGAGQHCCVFPALSRCSLEDTEQSHWQGLGTPDHLRRVSDPSALSSCPALLTWTLHPGKGGREGNKVRPEPPPVPCGMKAMNIWRPAWAVLVSLGQLKHPWVQKRLCTTGVQSLPRIWICLSHIQEFVVKLLNLLPSSQLCQHLLPSC